MGPGPPAEETAKLDLLEREVLPKALSGGPKGDANLWAVDRVLTIHDRRARMLGLDAPSKVEAVLKVELIVKALEATVDELAVGDAPARRICFVRDPVIPSITDRHRGPARRADRSGTA